MKTYLDTDLINSSYIYRYDNSDIIIYSNCSGNDCDCITVSPLLDYMQSNTYSCVLQSNNIIDSSLLTDNFYYRVDFYKILIIFIILCFIIIYCPIKIFLRFFKRFN